MAHPQIATFARLAKENAVAKRLIYGQKTLLSRTMHDISYDPIHDEFFVTNPFSQSILAFRGAANGEEPPLRVIIGPKTRIQGSEYAGVDRLEVDPIHNEIFVPTLDSILVFDRMANGDVAPKRVLSNPDLQLRGGHMTIAVDPVNDLLIVGGASGTGARPRGGSFMTFKRTASGDEKPLTIVEGPKTGILAGPSQMEVYSPNRLIVLAQQGRQGKELLEREGGFLGVWNLSDNGDVPPRWVIGGPKSTLIRPRGVALDHKHKELITVDMRQNNVLTYYFPEMF